MIIMTKERLKVNAETPRGGVIGRFRFRCCGMGEWFVYEHGRMLFETNLIGFDNFDLVFDATLDYAITQNQRNHLSGAVDPQPT